jgi:hypothetical protein
MGPDQLNQTDAITFAEDESREFTAKFFDQAGHEAKRTITITLSCEGIAACDGI